MSKHRTPPEIASHLPLTTITPDGLAILDDGTLIRAVRLDSALTPLRMSASELERTNRAVQEIPALLPDRQALQLITTARPFDWATEVNEIQATTAELDQALAADGLADRASALSRLAVAGAQALVQEAERLSAMSLEHLLIMPWAPKRSAGSKRHHTAAYYAETVEDLDARFRQIVTHFDTLGLAPKALDGEQFAASLYRALNPTGRPPSDFASLLHDPATDPEDAFDHAYDLRRALCTTQVDDSNRSYLRAGEHILESRVLSSTPEHTWMGWLLHLAQSPYPFTLSVRWEAGTRARERSKARARYKRIYGLQRGKEMRLKAVDFESRQREQEAANLTAELASSAGAGIYQVSVNLTLSSPPDPTVTLRDDEAREEDRQQRAKALQRWTRALEQEVLTRTDARLHLPWFAQLDAWRATWPLGIDTLGLKRRYVTQNLADTFPLVSAHCGSPSGIPIGWEYPGRTLAKLDPYDPWHDNHIMIVCARSGSGKALDVATPIATPSGWTTMGELAPGDRVFDENGKPCTVTATYDQPPNRPCFEVQFSDGTTIVADEDHRWLTYTHNQRRSAHPAGSVLTTADIRRTLYRGQRQEANHAIQIAAPLQTPDADLPLAPYTLGAWLGDGSSYHASLHVDDPEIAARVAADGYRVTKRAARFHYGIAADLPHTRDYPRQCEKCDCTYAPEQAGQRFCSRRCATTAAYALKAARHAPHCRRCGGPIGRQSREAYCQPCVVAVTPTALLRNLGVLQNKHIPITYLRASERQRRELLAGLLDTDGTVSPQGTVHYDTTLHRLADNVLELARSLGYRATITTKHATLNGHDCGIVYRVAFTTCDDVFQLARKRERLAERSQRHNPKKTAWRYIKAVRPVASRPVRCITVDSPSHLFLAGEAMVPTHNTMCTNLLLGRIMPMGATGGVIDRAGHYETLAKLVPGAIAVNLGTNPGFDAQRRRLDPWQMPATQRPAAVNPWDVEDPRELPTEKLQYLLALHSFFLGTQTQDGTYDLSPTDESLLSRAIREVYIRCSMSGEAPRELVLQEVLLGLANTELENGSPETASVLRRLADGLYDYVGDGSRAYLCDWPTTVDKDAPLVIFDTRHVGDADAGAVMFTIVEFLSARGARARERYAHRGPWGGRHFLVIDEGWKMLERKSTGRWINEQARRSRHNRLFLVAISQQLSDFTQHSEGAALVSQSSIQLFLRQHPEQAAFIQKTMSLTDSETDTVANLKTVKGQYSEAYMINGRRGRGLIQIRAGAAEYWYATSEPDHDQPLRNRVLEQHDGDMWAALADLAENHAPLTA